MGLVLIRDSISKCLFPDHVLHKESSDAAMFSEAFCAITTAMLLEFPLGWGFSALHAVLYVPVPSFFVKAIYYFMILPSVLVPQW